jgi:hypothetical protein
MYSHNQLVMGAENEKYVKSHDSLVFIDPTTADQQWLGDSPPGSPGSPATRPACIPCVVILYSKYL